MFHARTTRNIVPFYFLKKDTADEPFHISFSTLRDCQDYEIQGLPPEIHMGIFYPCSNPCISLFYPSSTMKLSQLLDHFLILYTTMYHIEEATASRLINNYTEECKECNHSFPTIPVAEDEAVEECSICKSEVPNVKLIRCKHIFHQECVQRWFETRRTCPLCRTPMGEECIHCNGSGVIERSEEQASFRLPSGERNETDGVYGIHSFFLEDLYFCTLIWDKRRNLLYLGTE